jgi:hypothetical protein
MRLEGMSFSAEEQSPLSVSCDGSDYTACFVLDGIVRKQKGEATELCKKACKGVPYACKYQ